MTIETHREDEAVKEATLRLQRVIDELKQGKQVKFHMTTRRDFTKEGYDKEGNGFGYASKNDYLYDIIEDAVDVCERITGQKLEELLAVYRLTKKVSKEIDKIAGGEHVVH